MRLPKIWTPHTVLVAPKVGQSSNGLVYGPVVSVPDVYVKDQQEVVTDASGKEVVSRASIRFNLDNLPPVGSKVTVWPGEALEYTAVMFKASRMSHPAWPGVGVGWLK